MSEHRFSVVVAAIHSTGNPRERRADDGDRATSEALVTPVLPKDISSQSER